MGYVIRQSIHEFRRRSSVPASEDASMSTQTLQSTANTVTTNCTECDARITATVALPGEILDCPDCGAELEVRSVTPLVVALAPQVEEDWGE